MDSEGLTSFKIDVHKGDFIKLETRLLGIHNVYNILAAVAIAHELGVDRDNIFIAIRQLKPVPHRLNLKKLDTGIFILDDAFNSNPKGAASAIDVLCNLKGNRKIVITPGMVELGSLEIQENRKFGQAMSKCVDYVILVGISVQTEAILEGLTSEGYSEDKIYSAKNFSDANQHCQAMLNRGDIVLYENDLPDTYNT
ncbi:UDP-N-acetylmuramyl pentapeptide synthase [Candidatus Magnetobacterium bavaricum]|uniref:UDP-N-acetylmuramyl pentapeptide synthase n=1 Tax=Candidatus Magnetobacterium bavaricum TaxID=29290 RepID=A0A0F3GKT0_9BACT|nr:UDP-N-acetylmuramyl pentapeptide synthase [Candidatus Magnetobacterium bavaricum]